MTTPVFDQHAVEQIIGRQLPLDAIVKIAQTGVVVQDGSARQLRRGEHNGKPIHVLVLKPDGVIHTAYHADEWDCRIQLRRIKRIAR